MTKRIWHKGPPPHVGWWNASTQRASWAWRWWDGKQWSYAVHDTFSAAGAAERAFKSTAFQDEIRWTDYYPVNARVSRIDPRNAS